MKPNTRHLINIMIYLGVFLLIQMIISTIAAFIFHGDVNSKPLPVIIISSVSSLLTSSAMTAGTTHCWIY